MEHPACVMARLTGLTEPTASTSGGGLASKVTSAVKQVVGGGNGATTLSAGGMSPPTTQDTQSTITTAFGHRLPTVTHALQVGGRPVSSDTALFEKQQTFNRAKTLERMVHPAGAGAFGYFEVTHDLTRYCKAEFLSAVGKRTPVFTRFSTVTFGREFPDSARNPRGFAVKFYTEDGNYDIVGLNWPIFFVRDPMKGPDVIRSQQRCPESFLQNYEATFDFFAANPESLHAGAMFFSDEATPVGFRHMRGFGCHTFQWVNAQGEAVFVKYHFVPDGGLKNFTFAQAQRMCGVEPDFAKRDLWEHLAAGREARWAVSVQLMTPAEARACAFDPFDVTKSWPEAEYPLVPLGALVLERNPENYHRDVEQAAFSPGNLVPGIEPSPDLLLNWRMFFYRDAQYHRLGVNHHQIPVNCPFMARFCSPQSRDGLARSDANGRGLEAVAASGPTRRQRVDPEADFTPAPLPPNAVLARGPSSRHEGHASEYEQARAFYLTALDDTGRAHLHANTAQWLRFCRDAVVRDEYLAALDKIDGGYRQGVESALEALGPEAPGAQELLDAVLAGKSPAP